MSTSSRALRSGKNLVYSPPKQTERRIPPPNPPFRTRKKGRYSMLRGLFTNTEDTPLDLDNNEPEDAVGGKGTCITRKGTRGIESSKIAKATATGKLPVVGQNEEILDTQPGEKEDANASQPQSGGKGTCITRKGTRGIESSKIAKATATGKLPVVGQNEEILDTQPGEKEDANASQPQSGGKGTCITRKGTRGIESSKIAKETATGKLPVVGQNEEILDTQPGEKEDANASQPQSGGKGTCISRKGTRGIVTSKIAKATATGKLSVVFDEDLRQPICNNAERFNNEIGFVVRNHGSLQYKEWRLVPEEVRAPLRQYLLDTFDINLDDELTKKCIDDQMHKAWKNYKFKLHGYFKKIGGQNNLEMAKSKPHPDLTPDQLNDWTFLCERWFSNEFKERAIKNANNRSKRKWGSRNGSVSTARHHIRRGMELTSPTGHIETWLQVHSDKEGSTDIEVNKQYADMKNLREIYSVEELPDKEIMELVLGRNSVYLRGWGRSKRGISNSGKSENSNSVSTSQPNQPSYAELLQQLDEANKRINEADTRINEVVGILRSNNLMPM